MVVLGAGLLLVTAAAAAGYLGERHYLHGRYAYRPGISSLARVWAFFRSVHHARVGIVGTFGGFFAYPLAGVDESNRVAYIGQRGPNGSFTAITSCRRWRATVDAAGVRYLVTTPARDPWHPRRLSRSPERGWTASDPAARIVLDYGALGQRISVFKLRGPLDPAGCAATAR